MAILVVRLSLPLPLAMLCGLLVAVALALLLGIPCLRLRADYLAIATVAAGEMVRYLAMNLPDLTGGPLGSMAMLGPDQVAFYNLGWQAMLDRVAAGIAHVTGTPVSRDAAAALIVFVVMLLLLVFFARLEHSPWGRVLKAIREDDVAAASVGKHVVAYKMQALILGAIIGGLSGMLLALQIGVFSPDDYAPTLTFYAYLILILGGMNRIWAIPLGAILFSLLYTGTRFLSFFPLSLFDSGSRAFLRLFLIGLMLVLFMALRPQGVLGDRRQLLLEK
jgi:branched-chain amino acid transport system permease protein